MHAETRPHLAIQEWSAGIWRADKILQALLRQAAAIDARTDGEKVRHCQAQRAAVDRGPLGPQQQHIDVRRQLLICLSARASSGGHHSLSLPEAAQRFPEPPSFPLLIGAAHLLRMTCPKISAASDCGLCFRAAGGPTLADKS